jgi:hypothetical protein
MQLGPTARGMLYIQLSNFPKHYLVIVVTDDEFRYALISVNVLPDSTYQSMVMEDIAWLDLRRIHGEDSADTTGIDGLDALGSREQKQEATGRNETRSGPYVAFFLPSLLSGLLTAIAVVTSISRRKYCGNYTPIVGKLSFVFCCVIQISLSTQSIAPAWHTRKWSNN